MIQLEHRVIEVIRNMLAGSPCEDDTVELKMEVPEEFDMAKKLAGMANAAMGRDLLWIFGADERGKRLVRVSNFEFSDWWSKVASHFDDGAPEPSLKLVSYDATPLFAVRFNTSCPPYVLKSPGHPQYWVPFRRGNSTQVARRRDLLSILVRQLTQPIFETVYASAQLRSRDASQWECRLTVQFYCEQPLEQSVVVPLHQCKFTESLYVTGSREGYDVTNFRLRSCDRVSKGKAVSNYQVHLRGPGMWLLEACFPIPNRACHDAASLALSFPLLGHFRDVLLRANMRRVTPSENQLAKFEYGSYSHGMAH